jgi:aryl-alcohol dehydrogenase-like predicted oxidoreductase
MKFKFSKTFNRNVSILGYGCWGIGGYAYGAPGYGYTDDEQSIAAIHKALDLGINYFDTANIYGDGRSETILGKALNSCRNEVLIATKAGKQLHGKFDFSPKSLADSIYGSIKRLNTDYIDLLQLHDPEPFLGHSFELIDCLLKLKLAGVVKHIGVSLKSPEDAPFFYNSPFEILQVNFNLIDQRAITEDLFFRGQEKNTEIVARTPLAFGFLTGRYSGGSLPEFQLEDHRSMWDKEQVKLWVEAPQKFQSILKQTGLSISELALRFSISQPNTLCMLSGMMTPNEVVENSLAVSDMQELPINILEEIYNVYHQNIFFVRH